MEGGTRTSRAVITSPAAGEASLRRIGPTQVLYLLCILGVPHEVGVKCQSLTRRVRE